VSECNDTYVALGGGPSVDAILNVVVGVEVFASWRLLKLCLAIASLAKSFSAKGGTKTLTSLNWDSAAIPVSPPSQQFVGLRFCSSMIGNDSKKTKTIPSFIPPFFGAIRRCSPKLRSHQFTGFPFQKFAHPYNP